MKSTLVKYVQVLRNARADYAHKKSKSRPIGYERMYHVHVRKSAGTSVNAAFWKKTGHTFSSVKRHTFLTGNGLVCVRNDKRGIEGGKYFYANSHKPIWSLTIPANSYTFCILRNPYERLLSLFRYYNWIQGLDESIARESEPYYDSLLLESACVKDGFDGFLDNAQKSHLLNQLYIFSERFNVEEAVQCCSGLSDVFFQDEFESAVTKLSEVAGMQLDILNERKTGFKISSDISEAQKTRAMSLLQDSFSFYNRMRDLKA